jgi:hypothetical protein
MGSDYVVHCLFVDDIMHIYSCDAIMEEFMQLYPKDFEITGGKLMETILGMKVKETPHSIKIHLVTMYRESWDSWLPVRVHEENDFSHEGANHSECHSQV